MNAADAAIGSSVRSGLGYTTSVSVSRYVKRIGSINYHPQHYRFHKHRFGLHRSFRGYRLGYRHGSYGRRLGHYRVAFAR